MTFSPSLVIAKTINGNFGQGRLQIRLEMASLEGPGMVTMSEVSPIISVARDMSALAISKKLDLRKSKIACSFASSGDRVWKMRSVQLSKPVNAGEAKMILVTDGFLGGSESPAISVPVHGLARHYDSLWNVTQPSLETVVDFLNQVAAPATAESGRWKIDRCKLAK
jgi:hypothetical protein